MNLRLRLSSPHCLAIHVLVILACFACWAPGAEAQTGNTSPTLSAPSPPSLEENIWGILDNLANLVSDDDPVVRFEVSGTDGEFFGASDADNWTLHTASGFGLDFERPVDKQVPGATGEDDGVAGNNKYVLILTVITGVGDRARTASITLTVTVRDAPDAEPPWRPQKLEVSGPWKTPNLGCRMDARASPRKQLYLPSPNTEPRCLVQRSGESHLDTHEC